MRPPRYPQLHVDGHGILLRGSNGRLLCRGCRKEVPQGRRTWCSRTCVVKYDPREVKQVVWMRDKGVCRRCSLDLVAKFRRRYPRSARQSYENFTYSYPEWAEFDHVIPFSEDGPTIAENMRLLCRKCHLRRTAEWKKQKACNNQNNIPQREAR